MKNNRVVVIYLLVLFLGLPEKVLGDKQSDSTKTTTGILPVIFYAPETQLGFGGIVYTSFRTNKKDSTIRKSTTQTYLNVTTNKQLLAQSDYSIFTKNNKLHFKGRFDYVHFPEYFYGLGNSTHKDSNSLIDFNSVIIAPNFYALIQKKAYVGVLLQHQSLYMLNKTLMNYSDSRKIVGDMGYSTTGVGLGLLIDNRDNLLNPSKGYYLESNCFYSVNHSFKNSRFTSLLVDARLYKTVGKKLVLNLNSFLSFNSGEVPFRMMPFIGGPRFLRGYYRGRFRDNNLILAQYEFRYPLFWRFGIAVFSGVGQVAQHTNSFTINDFHYNYGAGLRFKVDRKENANVRIDLGFTKDSHGLYIVFAEAF